MGPLKMSTRTVGTRGMITGFRILEGNYLQRRSDPRLLCVAQKLGTLAVIVDVVALHESSLVPVKFRSTALHPGTARAYPSR
jgi:hypothetical protein